MDGRQRQHLHSNWSLSLVIPAFNEAAGIRQAVEEADLALGELTEDYEVLVVDDGSDDNTAQVVAEEARRRPNVHLLRHAENKGYGAALRTGFQASRFSRVAFTDADCQFHLSDLASLVQLTSQHELAVGYRIDRQDPWRRRFFSWGYNKLVRALLGTRVRDCDCALKVFRREAAASLLPQTNGFFVNTEMLTRARQLGYQVAEAGVRHRPRVRGTSKVSLWDIPRTLKALVPFWWTRVLFPQADNEFAAHSGPVMGAGSLFHARLSSLLQTITLLVVAVALFFARLGCPLQEPEEPRYAEIPRQMLESGNFMVPICHGLPYYDKPPLLYWMVMVCYACFGVHDWAARLVPSGAAFLTVLLTYWWGRRIAGQRAAFTGAIMLCLSVRFVYLGRLLTMNSLLGLWVALALAAAHLALRDGTLRWRWWLLSAAACALGLLTKGPVTLLLVAVPVLAYQALDGRVLQARLRPWLAYLAVAVGAACPWYASIALSDPDFLAYFFWKHNLLRFMAPFDHAKPIWFYLPELLLGMLPWSLLLLPLVKFLGRREGPEAERRPASLGFFLLSSLWCLFFYSISGSKRAGYILPAMPPLALAFGCFLDFGPARLPSRQLIAARLGSLLDFRARSWAWCGITTFVVLFAALYLALPGYARKFSMRGQVRRLAMVTRNLQIPVVCYPRRWDSVSFYLARDDVRVYTAADSRHLIADLRANPGTLAFVKSDHSLKELLGALPASLEFVPLGRQGQVAVGWVQGREGAPPALFAGH